MSNRIILHIDFNSYFATVEQQANPRLRGKPIGVTGGDRMTRTVLGAASVEAKKLGVKTGMQIWEARQLCPDLVLVNGDSDKYLSCTQKFLNILKDYSPFLEVFSIDECFLEIESSRWGLNLSAENPLLDSRVFDIASQIKDRIRSSIGEWITCSIGISYNKVIAKLAGSLNKPDGLVIISDEESAMHVLDSIPLNEICGIGSRIKKRLLNMGVTNFASLRMAPKASLLAQFKSYGLFLYDIARGVNHSAIMPFYDKPEVKSIGHRHTLSHDTENEIEIKQLFLKLTELISRKLRSKNLLGRTITIWFRDSIDYTSAPGDYHPHFTGDSMQITVSPTSDGLEIFNGAWKIFKRLWHKERIRMIGVSISNLISSAPQNLSLLDDVIRQEKILQALDMINDRYGEFTLQRGILINTEKVSRKPNPFLADRRFKI